MTCSVCKKSKNEVHAKKSRLLPTMKLLLCNDCLENKREPRFVIVIVGRDDFKAVEEYIKHHRYVGADITAKELV